MNNLRTKLEGKSFIKGMHVSLKDPAITELVSNLNYDFIWIDTEHSAIDYGVLEAHLIAARAGGTPSVVRIPWNDPILVKRVLEQGPDGIVFPMINSAAEADRAMSSCLYPPVGTRGVGPLRAAKYGLVNMQDFVTNGHKELCRFIQIETETGVHNLENILENPFIDGVIIGAVDLSCSINRPFDVFCEENVALMDRIIAVCRERDVPVGISTGDTDPEILRFWRNKGMDIISAGMDFGHILSGAKKVLEILKTME